MQIEQINLTIRRNQLVSSTTIAGNEHSAT
jgi:hypothetical protein